MFIKTQNSKQGGFKSIMTSKMTGFLLKGFGVVLLLVAVVALIFGASQAMKQSSTITGGGLVPPNRLQNPKSSALPTYNLPTASYRNIAAISDGATSGTSDANLFSGKRGKTPLPNQRTL